MSKLTDQQVMDTWKEQPAPLLGVLDSFQRRDGWLSESVIREIATTFKIPIAELFGTISFYHHLITEPAEKGAPKVCTGPVCCMNGGEELLEQLIQKGATAMPCAGRCDEPVPVLQKDKVFTGLSVGELSPTIAALPLSNPDNYEECVFKYIREDQRASIEGYHRTGGYEALSQAIQIGSPEAVITEITDSRLTGRGGANFPTGSKWSMVAKASGQPKTIVCNADEGEPGCFKDRAILQYDPHQVIEGMCLAAYATGASLGFIYLRYEYPEVYTILERALSEAEEAGYLGNQILNSDFSFHIHLRRGAGAYICGEEGALLNSLEGKHPFPRNRPPFPVTHGFEDKPTVVNNVETLASVPQIMRQGAEWYRSLGLGEHAGSKVISLSGDIQRPGNYEIPLGLPLHTLLYDWAGGPLEGRTIQAVTMAGLSGGFLAGDDLDVTLDEPSIRSKGSFLGAGGIIVLDDRRNMVDFTRQAMEFYAEESCGKCVPCRLGTRLLADRLAANPEETKLATLKKEFEEVGNTMQATSACGLGSAAPMVTNSLMRYFLKETDAE